MENDYVDYVCYDCMNFEPKNNICSLTKSFVDESDKACENFVFFVDDEN